MHLLTLFYIINLLDYSYIMAVKLSWLIPVFKLYIPHLTSSLLWVMTIYPSNILTKRSPWNLFKVYEVQKVAMGPPNISQIDLQVV